jgi:ABC-2 type transport system ATP-binding protein
VYGAIPALSGVNLHVAPGEIVGLLGPNGAGKTTLIKILTGSLQPDEGSVAIDGLDVLTQRRAVQERIGYLAENAPLYPELSVQRYLLMVADLRRIPAAEQRARLADAIQATNLGDRLAQPIGTLSKGYRQRVGLAQAILHRPRLLILDEPSVGLDPTQIVEMRHLIRRLSEKSTILFSTHILSEVEALCTRAVVIMNGRVRADADLAELAQSSGAVLVLGPPQGATDKSAPGPNHDNAIRDALLRLPQVSAVRVQGASAVKGETPRSAAGVRTYLVSGEEGADLCPAIYALAAAQGWPLRELRPNRQTLESVYNQLATEAPAEIRQGAAA